MATLRRRFTEQMLERMRPPASGRVELGDDIVPGLLVRVTPAGTKSFSVIYKVPGETHRRSTDGKVVGGVSPSGRLRKGPQRRITLGRYPVLSLKRARDEARKILEVVSEGRDPRPERRDLSLARIADTARSVTRRFIEQDAQRSVSSWRNIERVLELHVLPQLGDRPIVDVRRADVHALLDDLVAEGRVGTAREVRKHLSRLFNWAVDREIVPDNPVHGLKRKDLAANGEAGRALAVHELRAIWAAAGELGYPFGPMYRLLMLTGQRRAEWARARRSEIDLDRRVLEIPAARFKGRRDHVVPLSDPAMEIVAGLPTWPSEDHYLLSTQSGRVPVSGFSKAKARLDAMALAALRADQPGADLAAFRVHDLRVTCETRLANLGINQETRDAVLGHAKPGLQRTYNKHDYLDEKRAALAAYAAHLMEVKR